MAPVSSEVLGHISPQQKQDGRQSFLEVVAAGWAELMQQSGCQAQAVLQVAIKVIPSLIMATQSQQSSGPVLIAQAVFALPTLLSIVNFSLLHVSLCFGAGHV